MCNRKLFVVPWFVYVSVVNAIHYHACSRNYIMAIVNEFLPVIYTGFIIVNLFHFNFIDTPKKKSRMQLLCMGDYKY